MASDRDKSESAKQHTLIQPNIGLDEDIRQSVVDLLNKALANEAVLAQKTRFAHWNLSGPGFFELQLLYVSNYKNLNEISDEIAERVRILGGIAIGSLRDFLHSARLDEQTEFVPEILSLLADHESCIRFLREDARKCTEEYEDEGTFELLVSVMRRHEKMAWVQRSFIDSVPVRSAGTIKIA